MAKKWHRVEKHPGIYYRIGTDGKRAYYVQYRDESGKQKFERVHGDLAAADRKRDEIKTKLRGGLPVNPPRKTFRELWEEWAATNLPKVRPSTAKTYRQSVERYLLPAFGSRPVQQITTREIARWVTDMQSKGRKAWTIRAAITPLRRVLAYAVRERLIAENPVLRLERDERPRGDAKPKRVLKADELAKLFRTASSRFLLPLKLATFTGLRASELVGLRWSDVDLGEGCLNVAWQLEAGEYVELKTDGARRKVFLMPALVKGLKAHRLASPYSQDQHPVFCMDDGSAMTYPSLEWGMKSASTKAGLREGGEPVPTLHSLRHGFGSMLIAQGRDVVFVSRQMGHASPRITLDIYAHEFGQLEQGAAMAQGLESKYGALL